MRNRSRRRTKLLKDEFFRGCVGQDIDMGYRHFDLTPCTGDVFMDRGIFRKLEHLESAAAVEGYAFHTNFTIPRHRWGPDPSAAATEASSALQGPHIWRLKSLRQSPSQSGHGN